MTTEVLDWYGIKHPKRRKYITWHHQDQVCTEAGTDAELQWTWMNNSPISSQGWSAWYSKHQIIRGVTEGSGRGGQLFHLSAKTFWLFSSFPCLWLLSKQLELKLFSCHSWRKVRFCHTDFLQQYFTTVIKTSWCVYERKCYFVKSLAEFFPNTLTALEASSQSCGKSEKDVLSVPTSDSQDQQGLQHENSLAVARDFPYVA